MTTPEKMKILQMLQDGTIRAEEAAQLLEALEGGKDEAPTPEGGKVLKIKVSDQSSGEVKVNIGLPLGVARFLKDLIPASERARIENSGVDLDAVFVCKKVGDSVCDGPCFARACACKNKKRSLLVSYGFALFFIQFSRKRHGNILAKLDIISLIKNGWAGGIRTPTYGTKTRCPAIRRRPK